MRKITAAICLLAASVFMGGCTAEPTVPTGADPVTTSPLPYTAPPETDTTVPPETEPAEPYWKESAVLVKEGEPLFCVVFSRSTQDEADRLCDAFARYGTKPVAQTEPISEELGAICLEITDEQIPEYYTLFLDKRGLTVRANSETAMTCAVDLLCALIDSHADDTSVEIPVAELTVSPLVLSPAPDGTTLLSARAAAYGVTINCYGGVPGGLFGTYVSKLEKDGYRIASRNRIATNQFAVAECASHKLFLSHSESDETLTVIFDRVSALLPEAELWDKITDTTLFQFSGNYQVGNFGMGYVVLLQDGTFVVIDGGTDEATSQTETEHTRLYNLLAKVNPRKDKKIVIRAWILTNGRYEHTTLAKRFAAAYGDSVTLEYLCCSAGNADGLLSEAEVTSLMHHYQIKPQLVLLHPGTRLDYCGTQLEVLFSDDWNTADADLPSSGRSAVIRMISSGQTALFCSDLQNTAAQLLVSRYGDALKCDLLQVPCHGTVSEESAVPTSFYDAADPAVVLWPNASGSYEADRLLPSNAYLLEKLHVSQVCTADAITRFILPYSPSDTPDTLEIPAK